MRTTIEIDVILLFKAMNASGLPTSRATRNHRTLRGFGITIRKTADMIIGTFCIERYRTLLRDDRDFTAIEQHLGLVVA